MVQVGENGQLYAARVISDTLEGQRTKSGMIYHPDSLSASVAGLPFGSRLRVTNPVTGASVVVTVIDRGPMDEEINLSASAADSLGFDGMVMLFVDILYTPPPMAIGP
jgi:rare lipoprotein A